MSHQHVLIALGSLSDQVCAGVGPEVVLVPPAVRLHGSLEQEALVLG